MGSMTIRSLGENVKRKLRLRAAMNNRSLEAEVRSILADAVNAGAPGPENLADAIAAIVDPIGGIEFELPSRRSHRGPVNFESRTRKGRAS